MVIKKVNALESSSSPVICLFLLSSAKHKVGNCQKSGYGEDALESGSCLFGGFSSLIGSLFSSFGGLSDSLFSSFGGLLDSLLSLGGGLLSSYDGSSGSFLNDGSLFYLLCGGLSLSDRLSISALTLDGYFLVDIPAEGIGRLI